MEKTSDLHPTVVDKLPAVFAQARDAGLIELMDPSALTEADDNPRSISDDRFADLKRGMQHEPEMLLARPIIIDAEKGDVVCGNMRLRAAKELNWEKIPVFPKRFESEAQRLEWMMRDNNEFGDWVPDAVAQMVANYVQAGNDGTLLGFGEDEVAAAVRRATGEALVPEPSEPPEPMLASEVVVEIRCTKTALDQIEPTLTNWSEGIDGLELAIVGN